MTDQTQNPYRSPEEVTEERVRGMTAEDWYAAARGLAWMGWKFACWLVMAQFGALLNMYPGHPWWMEQVLLLMCLPVAACGAAASLAAWRCLDGVNKRGRWFIWTSWAFWFVGLGLVLGMWNPYGSPVPAVVAVVCFAVSAVKWLEFLSLLAGEMKSRGYRRMIFVLMALVTVFATSLSVGLFGMDVPGFGELALAGMFPTAGLYVLLSLWLALGMRRRIRGMQNG